MSTIIGRKLEMQLLESAYLNKNAFVLMTGRRKVGKTTLIKKFIENKQAVYFSAREETNTLNRARFLEVLEKSTGRTFPSKERKVICKDWKTIFKNYVEVINPGRSVLVIDQADYIVKDEADFPKMLKYAWESYLKVASVMVILIMPDNHIYQEIRNTNMISEVTQKIRLRPVTFIEMLKEYNGSDFKYLVTLYSIIGGVPAYWQYFYHCQNQEDLMKVLDAMMFDPSGPLFQEPIQLLRQDVKELAYYNSVLKVLAIGVGEAPQIAKMLSLRNHDVMLILRDLIAMGYVEAINSITDKRGINSKMVRFQIADPLFDFYYKFVEVYQDALIEGHSEILIDKINDELETYCNSRFKKIAKNIFGAACYHKNVNFEISKIATFFNKKKETIDLVAVDEEHKKLYLADCYYGQETYGKIRFDQFVKDCQAIKDLKSYKKYTKLYGAFTVNQFENLLTEYALQSDDTILFDKVTIYSKE